MCFYADNRCILPSCHCQCDISNKFCAVATLRLLFNSFLVTKSFRVSDLLLIVNYMLDA